MRTRRHLLLTALALPAWTGAAELRRTLAPMTDGPFYPPQAWRALQPDWDADLTQVQRNGQAPPARGEHLALNLRVQDTQGQAVDGATIEIWQCDALGHYQHPHVTADDGRFDPGFQGFGAARTGADGAVAFRTIKPVPYPGRTPHIHVKLRHASFGEVTSQLFVAGESRNGQDFLWRRLGDADRHSLSLTLQPASGKGLRWQTQHILVVPG